MSLQIPLIASPKWCTSAFVDCIGPAEKREPDLEGTSISVTDVPFRPDEQALRIAEFARIALITGQANIEIRATS
jgi:hypothetical protein